MSVSISISERGISLETLAEQAQQLAGKELAAGVLRTAGKAKDGKADLVDVAHWNEYGTSHIPKRPFMRIAEEKNGDAWGKLAESIASKVVDGQMGAEQGLDILGNKVVGDMQEVIGNRGLLKANAPGTVKQKGSDAPLIDTGQLRQAISFEVR